MRIQRNIIETCDCFYTALPRHILVPNNTEPCLNQTQIDCAQIEFDAFNPDEVKESKECPLECGSLNYDITVSTLNYPSRNYYEQTTVLNDPLNAAYYQELIAPENLTLITYQAGALFDGERLLSLFEGDSHHRVAQSVRLRFARTNRRLSRHGRRRRRRRQH